MTCELIDLWITLQPFTGRRTLAVAAAAAMTPPLLAAAGAAVAAPKHISPSA
jgi:hypothetical protein